MNLECPLRPETKKWLETDKILCCQKTTLSLINSGHLCNPKQEERFCDMHKKDEYYLITDDRIVADQPWKKEMYQTLL